MAHSSAEKVVKFSDSLIQLQMCSYYNSYLRQSRFLQVFANHLFKAISQVCCVCFRASMCRQLTVSHLLNVRCVFELRKKVSRVCNVKKS